uniref:CSON010395 protein n=1 Tax=Culicoides sonorensis TaxID=179676 RepID=A0A336LHR0_CULSO
MHHVSYVLILIFLYYYVNFVHISIGVHNQLDKMSRLMSRPSMMAKYPDMSSTYPLIQQNDWDMRQNDFRTSEREGFYAQRRVFAVYSSSLTLEEQF